MPARLALAIPSAWRSRRTSVSKAAKTASMPKKARPAEVEVSTCCSSTLRLAPAPSISWAMLARSRIERPRRSRRVTTSVSTLAQDVQHLGQLIPVVALGAGGLFLEDHMHASPAQRLLLHGEVLINARYARISQQLAHRGPPMRHQGMPRHVL